MIISCSCGAKLKISDEKLSSVPVKVKCPRCGTLHAARRSESASEGLPAGRAGQGAAKPAAPAMPWFAAAAPADSGRPLVLIAHDSQAVAEMIAGVVTPAGMSTDHAPNGLEALKKAGSLKPQAMIIDVGLTGIYGFELCERLKGDPETSSIKIILLSSVYGLTSYKRAPETLYGADDYIEKHHIPDGLVPKLRTLLTGTKTAAARPAEQLADRGPAPQETPPATPSAPRARLVSRKGILQEAIPHPAQEPEQDLRGMLGPGEDFPLLEREPAQRDILSGTGTRNIPAPRPAAARTSPEPERDRSAPRTLPDASSFAEEVLAPPEERETASPSGTTELLPEEAPPEPEPDRSPAPAAARASAPAPSDDGAEAGRQETAAASDTAIEHAASLFRRDEFPAPQEELAAAPVDPAAIEKARRFARLIVSDIALYNQEAVAEGISKGTFYELLQEDITEGRAVYDKRVPDAIRTTGDYLQEAFDNFIASKKKRR
jgi:predicted Zn finger-like uncharacterized protein